MLSSRDLGTFPTLQVGILLCHVSMEIILPFGKACPVSDNLLGTKPVILRKRNKGQMQMGRFLVHVYHRRNDVFPADPVRKKLRSPLKIGCRFLCGFPLKKLRACGN